MNLLDAGWKWANVSYKINMWRQIHAIYNIIAFGSRLANWKQIEMDLDNVLKNMWRYLVVFLSYNKPNIPHHKFRFLLLRDNFIYIYKIYQHIYADSCWMVAKIEPTFWIEYLLLSHPQNVTSSAYQTNFAIRTALSKFLPNFNFKTL